MLEKELIRVLLLEFERPPLAHVGQHSRQIPIMQDQPAMLLASYVRVCTHAESLLWDLKEGAGAVGLLKNMLKTHP